MPAPFSANRLNPVTLAWIGGVVLAVVAYAVGPEHFVARVLAAVSHVGAVLEDIARGLTQTAMQAMRAAAIGCYGVFVALSCIGIGRTGHGRLGLVVVSVLFLLLVWGAWGDAPAVNTRWLAALLLSVIAALSATRRLSTGR